LALGLIANSIAEMKLSRTLKRHKVIKLERFFYRSQWIFIFLAWLIVWIYAGNPKMDYLFIITWLIIICGMLSFILSVLQWRRRTRLLVGFLGVALFTGSLFIHAYPTLMVISGIVLLLICLIAPYIRDFSKHVVKVNGELSQKQHHPSDNLPG